MSDVTNTREDLPLADDIAEILREVQVAVNDVKQAEANLAARNARLDVVLAAVSGVSPAAVAYINDFRGPATPPPADLIAPPVNAVNEGGDAADGADAATE